jgi:hypothetical protein
MNRNDAFIVILAFPDVVVRIANGELISKLWPLFGVGGQQKVMAGHAAMLLISKDSGKVSYFDFGRYITSDKHGRVRSDETDNEVHIPIKAKVHADQILNLDKLLLFLDSHPEKTHGEGRMLVGVNSEISYEKAIGYIEALQDRGEVPYGAFLKDGSNCARFVTDTILASTSNKKIIRSLKISYLVTPSPVSNVLKGSSDVQVRYEVKDQKIKKYVNTSLFREYKNSLFSKVPQNIDEIGSLEPNLKEYQSFNGQWLGGIGSGAWFELSKKYGETNLFLITIRNWKGHIQSEGEFYSLDSGFLVGESFEFQYGSNSKQCSVKQNGKLFFFKKAVLSVVRLV